MSQPQFIGRLCCEKCSFTSDSQRGISVHNSRIHENRIISTIEDVVRRFLEKIIIDKNGCWNWTGATRRLNYGCLKFRGKMVSTHRFIYEYYHGQINPLLSIDHLCKNHACSNPLHLEEVTFKENNIRSNSPSAINSMKTHCDHGHPFYSYNNLRILSDGERRCKICERIRARLYQQRKKKHE